jgi:hypothetical protein
MVVHTVHHGLEFSSGADKRALSIRGEVARLPVKEIYDFVRQGLPTAAQRAAFLEDVTPLMRQMPVQVMIDEEEGFFADDKHMGPILDYASLTLVRSFLNVVQTFVETDIRILPRDGALVLCRQCLEEFRIDDDMFVCNRCCVTQPLPVVRPVVPAPGLSVERELAALVDALALLEGRAPLDEEVVVRTFAFLDAEFAQQGVPARATVLARPCLHDGSKEGVTRDTMVRALTQLGDKSLVEHTNRLCNLYWGWSNLDYSAYHERVMANHRRFVVAEDKVLKRFGRRNPISRSLALYKHLQLLGAPINVEDFRIVKLSTVMGLHLEIWAAACAAAGLTVNLSM